MTVVAASGQSLGRNRPHLGSHGRLHHLEEREAHGLLQRRIAVKLDVRPLPHVVEIAVLRPPQAFPARPPRRSQGQVDLVAQRRQRPLARPPVGEELDDPQPLPRFQLGAHRQPGQVRLTLRRRDGPFGPIDQVVHRGGHQQPARPRPMHQAGTQLVVHMMLCYERATQRRRHPGVARLFRDWFIGHKLRLDADPRCDAQRLHLVQDGGHRPLDERHQPLRAHPDAPACR